MLSRKLVLNTLCEFGPILAFMVTYTLSDFEYGTIAMIVATLGALILLYLIEHHLPLFAILSTITVMFFGGLSLITHIPSIFILRDTLFDLTFGLALFVSVYLKRPLLKTLFKNVFAITDSGWSKLTLRWGFFFLFLAGLNEWVRLTLSPETWVAFKVITIVGTLAFGCTQFMLARKERLPDATPWGLVK